MTFVKKLISVMIIAILFAWLAGCSPTVSSGQASVKPSTNGQTSAEPSKSDQEERQSTEQGDGTLTISLNVTNPEQQQEKYLIAFTAHDQITRGKPVSDFYIKSYEILPDMTLTIQIEDLSGIMNMGAFDDPLLADLTVVRIEDTSLRNPLADPVVLEFIDTTTCLQGKDIKLSMKDEPLTTLYPEGTLLVKILQVPDSEAQGGYIDFKYKLKDGGMTLTFGRGSAGPDFLVAFNASDFKEHGIRDTVLSIVDFNNNIVSNQVELHFDESGYCQEGQFIIIERTK